MIHPVSYCLCETGPALSKIVSGGCGSGESTHVAVACRNDFFGMTAPPRTCSCTRGRPAKNIPNSLTEVAVGTDELIRANPNVNAFFVFFLKYFLGRQSPLRLRCFAIPTKNPPTYFLRGSAGE
jgi:hypothetical protein